MYLLLQPNISVILCSDLEALCHASSAHNPTILPTLHPHLAHMLELTPLPYTKGCFFYTFAQVVLSSNNALSHARDTTPMKSSKRDTSKDDTYGWVNTEGLKPRERTTGNQGILRAGERVFPRKKSPNCYSILCGQL